MWHATLRLGAGSNGEADTTPSGAGEFRPGKSRYEAYYSQGQGEDGTDGAIDVPAEDDVSELPPRPTNPFFVGYDDDELNAVWSVHAKLYGAREDAPADAPDPSFLPSPAAPALEPEVRSQLQAGAQQRKQQLEAFQQAAGCSEKQSGDQGEKQSGDQGQGRRKRKGWGK